MLVSVKLHCYILLLFTLLGVQKSFLGGLKFSGGEQPIDKRTSYNVFGDNQVTFTDSFVIDFNLSLYPTTQIGYIIRIKNQENNTIYNLFFDGQGSELSFKFNEEGKNNLITANMDKEELLNMHWFKMKLSFDLKRDSITLAIHDKTFGTGNGSLPNPCSPVILFGKSDFIIDVPTFAIKDLSVGNTAKYLFPLKENEGNIVHDQKGKDIGEVSNPEWLINDAYHWRYQTSFQSQSVAGANYNPLKKEIYYFNRDSIHIYNVRSGHTEIKVFDEKCPVELILGTNFLDPEHNKLYTYEVFYEAPYEGSTVASLDLNTYQWTGESKELLPTQLHHHGAYFDPSTEQYTLFGGFGSMHYSKNFFLYDLNTRAWNVFDKIPGDFLSPRYFSSVGYLKQNNSIYIFGGMGNESGEQIVGRKYYYDLYRIDLNTKQISKLWQIHWKEDNVVPVRGMVILNDSCFYTLCYPEHFSDSFLKLYRFSMSDGSYEVLGDSIPIHSDKITTNANLYYDAGLNNLYATVQEFDDDISSNLKVYSLAFPPITAEELKSYSKSKDSNVAVLLIVLISGAAIGISYLFYQRRRQMQETDEYGLPISRDAGVKSHTPARANSIYLFGDFEVRDRRNKDITYLFSEKLKQAFCLILQHSAEDDGIASQRLSDILWPGRPATKVKNSRGVTINHLRKALSELDGIELIYERGCFKIVQTDELYCDYTRCIQIISAENTEQYRDELLSLITRGKFLKLSDHSLYDSFKEAMEQKLEPVLLLELEKCFEAESFRSVINIAEAIFNIDPLNDTALAYQVKAMQRLKMSEEALIRYQSFVLEYKRVMGNPYPYSFKSYS
ncbi:DNA-binding transcriptional activator [Maribellus sp. CM-23]|uniref:Kelch repeat-containing protein n=1 Tax=Maribellus sp. CM-23 TaxID=2781026 RepID=UPI001F3106CA|nr:kelch repeat-containing protein [Maribellus sp. CM-23]MCE4562891.1 DNA-binding transcriptional activator [Maribellus sp. CM-23]